MRRYVLGGGTMAASLLALLATLAPAGPPPPPPRIMPGSRKGKVSTRWLAPYVSVTRRTVGNESALTVQWFGRDGRLARSLSGGNVNAHPGYVLVTGEGAGTVRAVNGDWQFPLPAKAGPPGYITATEDSRTFVHQFHPKEGEIAADIYVAGKLAGTVGPFPQYKGMGIEVGADGSVALLAAKPGADQSRQVVVAGPDAKVRFRVKCDGLAIAPAPAPGGTGVLVRTNASGDARNTFTFYTKAGKASSLNVGPNAGLLAWLPGTTRAVMHTSIGYDYRFHLVDWKTGKRLWEIADPNPARVPGSLPASAVTAHHLLVGGRQQMGPHNEPVLSLYALDIKTGKRAAHWLPAPLRPAADDGHFLQLGKDLYLITDEEFSLIHVAEITGKKNGWK